MALPHWEHKRAVVTGGQIVNWPLNAAYSIVPAPLVASIGSSVSAGAVYLRASYGYVRDLSCGQSDNDIYHRRRRHRCRTLNGQRIICIRRTQYTRSSSGFLTLVYNNVDADGWAICSDLDEWARVPPAFASLSMVNGLPPDVIYDFMIAVQEFPQIKMLMLLP